MEIQNTIHGAIKINPSPPKVRLSIKDRANPYTDLHLLISQLTFDLFIYGVSPWTHQYLDVGRNYGNTYLDVAHVVSMMELVNHVPYDHAREKIDSLQYLVSALTHARFFKEVPPEGPNYGEYRYYYGDIFYEASIIMRRMD